MTAAVAALVVLAVGAGLLAWAWIGSQRRSPAQEAAAAPLGLAGGVVSTCGVGLAAVGLDVIGVVLATVAASAAVLGVATAAVRARRVSRARGSGRR